MKLILNLDNYSYIENFLISTVATILGVRLFLQLSGYPQIGGGGLHIAHMLWGGALLVGTLFANLLFIDRNIKKYSAIIGGIGFGLFIDELGKFITSDNNYFYQPTISLIYLILIVLYLGSVSLVNHWHISKSIYLANVFHFVGDAVEHGMSPSSNVTTKKYLTLANKADLIPTIQTFYAVNSTVGNKHQVHRLKQALINKYEHLISNTFIRKLIIFYICTSATLMVLLTSLIVFIVSQNVFTAHELFGTEVITFSSLGLTMSTIIASFLAFAGLLALPFSNARAYSLFKIYLLFSITVVQFYQFQYYQFGALTGLLFNLIALQVVNKHLHTIRV